MKIPKSFTLTAMAAFVLILLGLALLSLTCRAVATPTPTPPPPPTHTPSPQPTPTSSPSQPTVLDLGKGAVCDVLYRRFPASAEIIPAEVVNSNGADLMVTIAGSYRRVSFLGIIVPGDTEDTINGLMAETEINNLLPQSKAILLVDDPLLPGTVDSLGRELLYVVADGVFVNHRLAGLGLAAVVDGEAPACNTLLLQAQSSAQLMLRGVWVP